MQISMGPSTREQATYLAPHHQSKVTLPPFHNFHQLSTAPQIGVVLTSPFSSHAGFWLTWPYAGTHSFYKFISAMILSCPGNISQFPILCAFIISASSSIMLPEPWGWGGAEIDIPFRAEHSKFLFLALWPVMSLCSNSCLLGIGEQKIISNQRQDINT